MEYLREANDTGEKVTNIFMQFPIAFFLFSVALGIVLVIYSFIYFGHFEADELFLPYNYVFVFFALSLSLDVIEYG